MITVRFSGERLVQLKRLLCSATDHFCRECDECSSCKCGTVCGDVYDLLQVANSSKILCITVTREK